MTYPINHYGLSKRVTSSEHVLLEADDMATVFAYSEWKEIHDAHEQLTRTRTAASVAEVIESITERQHRIAQVIRNIRRPEVRQFVSDLDSLRALIGDITPNAQAAVSLGAIGGMLMVIQAAAVARAITRGDEDAEADFIKQSVATAEAHARSHWDRLRADLLKRQGQSVPDAPFELVTNPEAKKAYFRVPVIASTSDLA